MSCTEKEMVVKRAVTKSTSTSTPNHAPKILKIPQIISTSCTTPVKAATPKVSFEKTIRYLKDKYPTHFIIADAKRGDIGNTSARYAQSFFEEMNIDAVTVAP